MFDKIKGAMELHAKMMKLKEELGNTIIDVESPGKIIKISINGNQEIKSVKIIGDISAMPKEQMERILSDVISDAVKKSHQIMTAKMELVAGINLPNA